MSCIFGALSVLLAFFAARELFGDAWSAILCELILALGFLHVQDSTYARVESFLSLLILLCLYFSAKSLSANGRSEWSYAAAFFAGVAIAAKYNAVPVLIFVAFAVYFTIEPFQRRLNSTLLAIASYSLAVILGFVMATPEVLINPMPLIDGIVWEVNHYANGHIPYEAYDLWDNNVFYYSLYLLQVGLGVVSCLLTLGFLYLTWRERTAPMLMLASFLCVACVLTLVPTVRFERNLEILFGPLTIASGTTAGAIISWAIHRYSKPVLGLATAGLLLGIVVQPAVTLYRFRDAVRGEFTPQYQYLRAFTEPEPTTLLFTMDKPPPKERRDSNRVVLFDFGDKFSESNANSWEQQYAGYDRTEFQSLWSAYGYLFTTIDVYHGPARLIVFTRPETPKNLTQGSVQKPE